MSVWIVTGELGSGKTLMAISKIQAALLDGRRVATNIDIRLEKLVTPRKRRDVYRLPDHPKVDDLKELGLGYEGGRFYEKRFGLIVLDEAATFLNSREYLGSAGTTDRDERKKEAAERMRLITWFRHCRKFRWHLILITQDVESLDAQVRRALAEHVVNCRRLDAFSVPIVSFCSKLIGFGAVKFPQVHLGVVHYKGKTKVDTWWLPDARLLHGAYDTQQKIVGEIDGPATMFDGEHGPYMWKPRGVREFIYNIGGWRFLSPSAARSRYDDFRLFEAGLFSYKLPPVSYAQWLEARRVTAPEGAPDAGLSAAGGEGGAAREVLAA